MIEHLAGALIPIERCCPDPLDLRTFISISPSEVLITILCPAFLVKTNISHLLCNFSLFSALLSPFGGLPPKKEASNNFYNNF